MDPELATSSAPDVREAAPPLPLAALDGCGVLAARAGHPPPFIEWR
jgi:hypothetical protein